MSTLRSSTSILKRLYRDTLPKTAMPKISFMKPTPTLDELLCNVRGLKYSAKEAIRLYGMDAVERFILKRGHYFCGTCEEGYETKEDWEFTHTEGQRLICATHRL